MSYRIIRIDGTEESFDGNPKQQQCLDALGANALAYMVIGRANVPPDEEMMIMDDTAMSDGKPINPKATTLYHRVCVLPSSIHGDVIIWKYDHYR